MRARLVIEAETPKGILQAVADQAKAEYEPTDYEKGVLAARDSKNDLQRERYLKVKELRDQGMTFKQIAQQFNVSPNMIRVIFMRGQRHDQIRPQQTPEHMLSNRAVNWLSYVLGIKLYDEDGNPRQWGREAARKLGELSIGELMKYRNFGPKLYTELRHWAQTNYGVRMGQPDEASAISSQFQKLIPKPPTYDI